MLECTLADQVADLPPGLISSGQEWQFQVPYKHINWQIYSHPPQMHYGIYIMGCIWQLFWILQEKVGIFLYFWIIWVVNSQLAL